MMRTAGRLLVSYWPALLAWFLAGELGRYLSISSASYVAQVSSFAGALLVGLGVLSKLISLVAMLLVMRDGLHALRGISPAPKSRAERRTFFVDAVLSGIVPFFLFYEVWGYLQEDWVDFASRTTAIWVRRGGPGDIPAVGTLGVSVATVSTALAAFIAVWFWRRYRARLPKWTSIPSVLLEMLWTYLFVLMIGDAISAALAWVQSRRVLDWFSDFRGWLAEISAPAAWLWDTVGSVIGGLIELLALPFAWLTIVGVIYGVALQAEHPILTRSRKLKLAQEGWLKAPMVVRAIVAEVVHSVVDRVEPIWKAFTLMLRAGPVIVFGYVLAYTVTLFAEEVLRGALIQVLGPHDLRSFWQVADTALFLIVPLIVLPIRMALIAATYDELLERASDEGRLDEVVEAPTAATPTGTAPAGYSEFDLEAQKSGQLLGKDDIDEEGALSISRNDEGHEKFDSAR